MKTVEPPLSSLAHLLSGLADRIAGYSRLEGISGAQVAFVVAALTRSSPAKSLWICDTNREADRVARDLGIFLKGSGVEVVVIPGFEADPYRGLSPHPEITEQRAISLSKLLHSEQSILAVAPLASVLTRLPTPANFKSSCVRLDSGAFFPIDHLLNLLVEAGYLREDPVGEVGEFSHRGGIVDVFTPGYGHPLRIEFFGDQIDSIREFSPATQRSVGHLTSAQIIPMREWVLSNEEIARWHRLAPDHWNEVRFAPALQEKLQFTEEAQLFNGFEYLMPLALPPTASLFTYLKSSEDILPTQVLLPNPAQFRTAAAELLGRLRKSYQERDEAGELALPPERLFLVSKEMEDLLQQQRCIQFQDLWDTEDSGGDRLSLQFQPSRQYQGRIRELLKDLEGWRSRGERVVFVMETLGMAERTVDLLADYEIAAQLVQGGLPEALRFPVSVTEGRLSEGFFYPDGKLHLLPQENVFGTLEVRHAPPRAPARDQTAPFLSDFRDLRPGDYVVHVEHGVGVFTGLRRIGVGETEREFVELAYQNDAKLFVPIDRLDLLQKFSGAGQAHPQLDRLGGVSWERTKSRIRKAVRHLAEDLLKLYARREVAQGRAFPPDDELMKEFDDAFEFEETTDQQAAIEDVRRDMESPRPMDRLICGDVGYGKTEVAMRAAFRAVCAQTQVAVLAPTTVLAYQHLRTFRERFRGFPLNIEMLSRFQGRQEQKEIVEKAKLGLVDILIGTHRILSKDVRFRELGLVVVDEEQRFGVAQKERLKRLKTQVDVLTLSATPIPRTLNMSLIGVRDLSIIETPPRDRLAIQTVVVRFSNEIIRSAIDLELKRKGQVFFVHNQIETIHSIALAIQEIIPEARVGVAHGQMGEHLLEDVMMRFLNYEFDVLVSTTIIENGLDIPRANTLIVNRADRFGLSQLYQLRGRVGRSNRRAYAYLIIPSEEVLTTEARQRLAAIREFSDLGTGFRIAALDLEIRGAGSLLGAEQSGHINAIGLDLYMKLLQETIRELKGEEPLDDLQTTIDLRVDIQIPDHYIPDSNQRLWLYKRISVVEEKKALAELRSEIIDRFGKYPRAVANLLEYAAIRLEARPLRILAIDRKGEKILIRFRPDTPVQVARLVAFVSRRKDWTLSPEGVVGIGTAAATPAELFQLVHSTLEDFAMLV